MAKKENLDPRILEICGRIKQLRIDQGFKSYEHFALEKGLGRMSYYRIEKGSNLKLSSLFKYLDLMNITLEEFVLYGKKYETLTNGKH